MEDYCIACGELVPEGHQVCETCIHNARKARKEMDYGRELNNNSVDYTGANPNDDLEKILHQRKGI